MIRRKKVGAVRRRTGKTAGKRRKGSLRKQRSAAASPTYGKGYNQGFDQAYNDGFNAGYAEGVEQGRQMNNEQI